MTNTVIILDYGSQFTQLIARRVREQSVYCEILPFDAPLHDVVSRAPKAIILSGGPASVTADDAPPLSEALLELGVPILGICYGLQVLTRTLGGTVSPSTRREYGRAQIRVQEQTGLFAAIGQDTLQVWMSHGDHVSVPAPGFRVVAKTDDGVIAAVEDQARQFWGVQFHPEVVHTPQGQSMIAQFIHGAAGIKGDWTPTRFVDEAIERVRAQVGDARVICGLSGGVDSAVAAALIHKAIGLRQTCVFVNNGLLRKGEAEEVREAFGADGLGLDLRYVDASDQFLTALQGVTDPERKRKIIGHVFVDVFEAVAAEIPNARFLAQGTLYPDVIESVSVRGPAAVIKSHHNVGGLPERMNLTVCEPLRELFKDEVRVAGLELNLPEHIIWRHPFPGPGLAIRVLGEVTEARLKVLREADFIVREEVKANGLHRDIWQVFCVLLPVRTVGVMGDDRTYENVLAIRAVSSVDGMTADWFPIPYDVLGRMSTRIINEVAGINRVVYDISSKPPATIEWE
ncbi:MAG: glutamine-hydrolyzing GMP synthase [Myxococcota bacterium]|nr:glutamine-hydrolyzing GMP synthase [Myxococcota bacterium]